MDKQFDYSVPERWADAVRVGTVVRVPLHGRRVRGWVTGADVVPEPGVNLKPITKVSGWGPPPGVVELADWAAWRWAGRSTHFLTTASPPATVARLPAAADLAAEQPAIAPDVARALQAKRAVMRIGPAWDARHIVLGAIASAGGRDALVLCPSVTRAEAVAARLRRIGLPVALLPRDWAMARAGGAIAVGARAAAWAPLPMVRVVVVLDAHDEAYQEEAAPTWNAWEVVAERAARDGAPCVLVTPCPTLEQLDWGELFTPSREDERAGWATIEIADRRDDDPRTGLYSPSLVTLLRSGGRVACVLNRKGRAQLLACRTCREVAVCEQCDAVVAEADGALHCRRCGRNRPFVCLACGSAVLKGLRAGVTKVREELEALGGAPVVEVTGDHAAVDLDAGLLVGTEAVLHRVASSPASRLDAVAFLEFDQELLAPRYRAGEQALGLLARASRLVRGRAGRVLVQTRTPEHEVLRAALHADPGLVAAGERERRNLLAFPPARALAMVSGEGAAAFAEACRSAGVEVLGPTDGRWLVRAPDHLALCDALASVERPPGRLRVEVDPARI